MLSPLLFGGVKEIFEVADDFDVVAFVPVFVSVLPPLPAAAAVVETFLRMTTFFVVPGATSVFVVLKGFDVSIIDVAGTKGALWQMHCLNR